jgi:prefoldin subunit 2
MPEERKCFRMIQGVLVESTVKDVLPTLEETQAGVSLAMTVSLTYQIKGIVAQLTEQYKKADEDLKKWKKDNNVQIVSN